MDWSAFLSSLTGAAAAAGVVGVAFGKILEKGIDAKLKAQDIELTAALHRQTEHYKSVLNAELGSQLEAQKTELAKSVHRQNAVFTRIHQQRSDVVQKLGEQISSFRWELVDFRPKTPIGARHPDDAGRDALEWCFELMLSTKEPVKTAHAHSMLLPAELPLVIGVWASRVNEALEVLMQDLSSCMLQAEFDALPGDGPRRQKLRQVKTVWDAQYQSTVAEANNLIMNRLRILFDSVEHPNLGGDRLPIRDRAGPDDVQ